MKKICVVTGTRAEYGLLSPLIEKINNEPSFKLQLVVTGMHLSPEFGLTYKEIINDGFNIDEKVEILLSSDTAIGISKSMGLAIISFAEVFERLKPDMLIILGDRYEIYAVATAASIAQIPISHLHGGEKTEGCIDEFMRHSITKMSYLHFTSTTEYMNRVIQLGEEPNRVFNVGALGVENILNTKLLSLNELEKSINFSLDGEFALATFHPVTLENNTAQEQFQNLIKAIENQKNLKVIFTKSNSDTDGRIINKMIDEFVSTDKKRYIAFESLGKLRYLSAMKYCSFVIGNSSSGLLETPTFNKPTINIGDRQKGRIKPISVIDCNPIQDQIEKSIEIALSNDFNKSIKNMENLYGDGTTSTQIIENMKKFLLTEEISLKKYFYDINN